MHRFPLNVFFVFFYRAQYTVLVPALWKTEVQDWELKCMNSLVLDESQHREMSGKTTTRLNIVMNRNEDIKKEHCR